MMNDSKKLLVVTTAHPPNDKRVYHKFVRSFLADGWQVSWIGPRPTSSWDGLLDRSVQYHWAHPFQTKIDRVLSRWRVGRLARDVEDAPDWIYCPDPDSVPIGLGLGDRLGAKVIFDIHEVYHTTHVGHWLKGNQIPLVNSQIQRVISRYAAAADLAVGVSNGVLEAYCSGLDHGLLLRNCPPAWFAGRTPGQSFSSGSDFRLMHGLIGPNRGTRELITALANHTGSSGSIVLSCFGQDEELNKLVSTGSLEKIRRQGVGFSIDLKQPIPYESMPDHLRTCHAGVVSYTGPMSGPNLANRVFEYMALGLPVLAPLQSPEIVEVVRSAGTGLVYDLDRPESILEAVTKLMTDPGLRSELGGNGRRLFLDEFTWESQFKQLLARLNGPNPRTR